MFWESKNNNYVPGVNRKIASPGLFRNVVEFSGGPSTRVVGFKVEAGFVAGMSSASETIIAERSLCRQWGYFWPSRPATKDAAHNEWTSGIVGLIRANVNGDKTKVVVSEQNMGNEGMQSDKKSEESHIWPRRSPRGETGAHGEVGKHGRTGGKGFASTRTPMP